MTAIKSQMMLPDGNGGFNLHHSETEVAQVLGLKEKYRQPNTTYAVGNIAYHSALPTGYYLECTTAGTTSAGDITPSSTIGGTVADGTVVWTVMKNLPLSGGDMVGADAIIGKVDADGVLRVRAGLTNNDSGSIHLYGKDSNIDADFAGGFMLSCGFDTSGYQKFLIGLPDGRLSWGPNFPGYDLAGSAIIAKSLGTNGYIKYASGLIVQWGFTPSTGQTPSGNGIPINLNVSFTNTNYIVIACNNDRYFVLPSATAYTKDKFTYWARNENGNLVDDGFNWIAIG